MQLGVPSIVDSKLKLPSELTILVSNDKSTWLFLIVQSFIARILTILGGENTFYVRGNFPNSDSDCITDNGLLYSGSVEKNDGSVLIPTLNVHVAMTPDTSIAHYCTVRPDVALIDCHYSSSSDFDGCNVIEGIRNYEQEHEAETESYVAMITGSTSRGDFPPCAACAIRRRANAVVSTETLAFNEKDRADPNMFDLDVLSYELLRYWNGKPLEHTPLIQPDSDDIRRAIERILGRPL